MAGTLTLSVLKNDTTSPTQFQNSAGTEIGRLARAWVNFDGTTSTIRSSFNVSSITNNGTGDYTLNFTTALPDANYAYMGGGKRNSTNPTYTVIVIGRGQASEATTTTLRIMTTDQATNPVNMEVVSVSIFR